MRKCAVDPRPPFPRPDKTGTWNDVKLRVVWLRFKCLEDRRLAEDLLNSFDIRTTMASDVLAGIIDVDMPWREVLGPWFDIDEGGGGAATFSG